MDDRVLLEAIGKMMDEKLAINNEQLRQEMKASNEQLRQEMKTSNEQLRQEMKASNEQLRQEMKASSEQLRQEIMLDFNTVIEDKVSKEIRLIAEQHSDIVARLPYVEEQAEIKSRVRVLERVVSNLGAEIDKLKKAE
jgi:D-ribose pyranose/furanose isomerase RbsD